MTDDELAKELEFHAKHGISAAPALQHEASERIRALSAHVALLKASLAQAEREAEKATASADPVAWANFAETGNIRIWTSAAKNAVRIAKENGIRLTPLYTTPQPDRVAEIGAELLNAVDTICSQSGEDTEKFARWMCDESGLLQMVMSHFGAADKDKKIAALEAEVERLRKDAERYQQVRRGQKWSVIDGIGATLRGERLDDAIDAAMAGKASTMTRAALDVLAERARQISVEGWTPEHDDLHEEGQLAGAAAGYARHVNARGWVFAGSPDDYKSEPPPIHWPWADEWWKPSSPRRDLIKAGALILAEIERIDRATEKEAQS